MAAGQSPAFHQRLAIGQSSILTNAGRTATAVRTANAVRTAATAGRTQSSISLTRLFQLVFLSGT